ncbi:winged helix-turn-helix transcriptional regulator, partial [Streptomyces sp. NPDC050610]|uniref:winged helix-turn-helix transcriptional regulator n=1 Tax=Streptomyces sp. NPDC050610 TaxID=3157097 RepID=UPI003431852C
DREILFHLRRDGRLTNVELAKRVRPSSRPHPCGFLPYGQRFGAPAEPYPVSDPFAAPAGSFGGL